MKTLQHDSSKKALSAEEVVRRACELVESHYSFVGREKQFEFHYDGNVLTVRGRVPSFYLKQLLHSAIRELHGMCRIDCQVTVTAAECNKESR